MAATVSTKELNGTDTGTPTTVTAPRFCTSDIYNPAATYPLVKPASGTNYSYEKSFYLNADTAPAGTINNIKFYSDGTITWTGVVCNVGTTGTYTQHVGTEGVSGTESGVATTAVTTYTVGSPLSVVGSITTATGKISDIVVMQAAVGTAAVAGTLAAETMTWKYDET